MSAASGSASTDAHRRLRTALGVGAVVVSFGGLFVAAVLSPWFSVFEHALSDLGATGTRTAPVFNLSLLIGGALGCGFVVAVWPAVVDPVRRGALVVLFFAMIFLSLTGAFPLPLAMHSLVSPLFFLLLTLGVVTWGIGDLAAGRGGRGAALVIASVTHVVGWFWWAIYGWPGDGIAVPELVGAATLAVWALWLAVDAVRALDGGLPSGDTQSGV